LIFLLVFLEIFTDFHQLPGIIIYRLEFRNWPRIRQGIRL
jgi:hypothetical protein